MSRKQPLHKSMYFLLAHFSGTSFVNWVLSAQNIPAAHQVHPLMFRDLLVLLEVQIMFAVLRRASPSRHAAALHRIAHPRLASKPCSAGFRLCLALPGSHSAPLVTHASRGVARPVLLRSQYIRRALSTSDGTSVKAKPAAKQGTSGTATLASKPPPAVVEVDGMTRYPEPSVKGMLRYGLRHPRCV